MSEFCLAGHRLMGMDKRSEVRGAEGVRKECGVVKSERANCVCDFGIRIVEFGSKAVLKKRLIRESDMRLESIRMQTHVQIITSSPFTNNVDIPNAQPMENLL